MTKNLLVMADLAPSDVQSILEIAETFPRPRVLENKGAALVFRRPSWHRTPAARRWRSSDWAGIPSRSGPRRSASTSARASRTSRGRSRATTALIARTLPQPLDPGTDRAPAFAARRERPSSRSTSSPNGNTPRRRWRTCSPFASASARSRGGPSPLSETATTSRDPSPTGARSRARRSASPRPPATNSATRTSPGVRGLRRARSSGYLSPRGRRARRRERPLHRRLGLDGGGGGCVEQAPCPRGLPHRRPSARPGGRRRDRVALPTGTPGRRGHRVGARRAAQPYLAAGGEPHARARRGLCPYLHVAQRW